MPARIRTKVKRSWCVEKAETIYIVIHQNMFYHHTKFFYLFVTTEETALDESIGLYKMGCMRMLRISLAFNVTPIDTTHQIADFPMKDEKKSWPTLKV